MIELTQKKCKPCEGYEKPMEAEDIKKYISQVNDWEVVENRKIKKEFRFKDFQETMNFVNRVAELSESENHHPNIYIFYNRVRFELSTHVIHGLSENDFIMAAKIDELIVLPS